MLEVNQSKNEIILKQDTIFLIIGFTCMFMAGIGFKTIFELLPFEERYTSWDIFGVVFVFIWILIVLGMGIYAIITNSKKTTISEDGILCTTYLTKEFIKWSEVKDWGLSYCGQTRYEGNTYHLYFSKKMHPIKNDCSKKLRGKMIKVFIIGYEYTEAINQIIPFCKEKSNVEPFIGKDTYHFL